MESWLREANESIKSDAEFAFDMCLQTAENESLDREYVLDTFILKFRELRKGISDT